MGLFDSVLRDGKSDATESDWDVFIAFSSKDKNIADEICYVLEQNRIKCWIAPRDIAIGANYASEISEGIRKSKLAVLVASNNAYNSIFCITDISMVFNNNKPILSFKIDDSDPQGRMGFFLRQSHRIEAYYPNHQDSYYDLVKDVMGFIDSDLDYREIYINSLKHNAHENPADDYGTGGPSHDVFISYSLEDKSVADDVCHALGQNGIEYWMCSKGMEAGKDYGNQIYDAIVKSDLFLMICSKNTYESTFSKNEMDIAISTNKPILALEVDEGLAKFHGENVTSWIPACSDLEDSLDALVGEIKGLLNLGEDSTELKRPFDAYSGGILNMSHDVFISYSTKDANMAQDVCQFLEENSIRCWIAPRNLRTGNDYVEQVADAVKSAKLVVLIGSSYSYESKFVKREISLAFNNDIPIIPFMIDDALPKDEMNFFLMKFHRISAYYDTEEYFPRLLESVLMIMRKDELGGADDECDVIICFSSRNLDLANDVCDVLERNGVKCWLSARDIWAGEDFAKQIFNAIEKVRLVVFIASESACRSNFAKSEIEAAFKNNKPILAFQVEDNLSPSIMDYYLKRSKWIKAYPHPNEFLGELVSEVTALLPSECESVTLKRPFDAYSGDEPYIFVSYAHKDSDLVFKEIRKFHDAGYHVWYDQGLTAGQEWDEEIEDALIDCSLLVVFISENSMASNNVVDEIKLALEEKIDIVPIYLEDAKLARGLKLRLSQKHSIFKYNSSEEEYLNACFKAFDSAGIPRTR